MGQILQPTYRWNGQTKRSKVWWIRYSRNGKRYQESAHSTKKSVAIDLLRKREGAIANGEPITSAMAKLTFDDAVKDVVTDYRINKKRSIADVERRIKLALLPYFGGRRMTSITTTDVRAYIAHRQAPGEIVRDAYTITRADGTVVKMPELRRSTAGATNATINRELSIVKRAFRLARQAGKLLHVPYVPMLREANVRKGFFERDQFEAVREALPEDLRGLVTLAYFTGWRVRSEVLPLTWPQVDRTAQTIRLEPGTTKNSEGRVLPYGLLPDLVTVIDAQWQAHEALQHPEPGEDAAEPTICPYVFQRDGAAVKHFRRAWLTACAAAGVPGRIPHDFRRTAVRNLVRAGVPEKTAMGVTGHKTRSVFDRYDIVDESDLRNALGKLAAPAARGQEEDKSARRGRVRPFRSAAK